MSDSFSPERFCSGVISVQPSYPVYYYTQAFLNILRRKKGGGGVVIMSLYPVLPQVPGQESL